MTNSNLRKIGRLMVQDGKYTDKKDGKEKNRYHEIGIVFATPHHSNICVRFHATAAGTGQFATVFYDDEARPNFTDKPQTDKKAIDVVKPSDEVEF